MKPKGVLIAVVLLAVLGGLIWWSNKKQLAASKATSTTETKILTIPEDQILEIKIRHANGDMVDLRRDSGKWRLMATSAQPKPLSADPDTSSSLVSALTSVSADKTIEDK